MIRYRRHAITILAEIIRDCILNLFIKIKQKPNKTERTNKQQQQQKQSKQNKILTSLTLKRLKNMDLLQLKTQVEEVQAQSLTYM